MKTGPILDLNQIPDLVLKLDQMQNLVLVVDPGLGPVLVEVVARE